VSAFEDLSDNELRALGSAFEVGALSQGVTLPGLRSVLPDAAASTYEYLEGLANAGWQSAQLKTLCEEVLAARRHEDRLSNIIDLVISGPEVDGVFLRDTGTVFRELVREAEREIMIATYAIYNGRELFADLAAKLDADPAFDATFYLDVPRKYQDTTSSNQLIARYRNDFVTKQWPGQRLPKLFYFTKSLELEWQQRASMHAKVVLIDGRKVFVSSANLTNAAQKRNVEVGVIVEDVSTASRVRDYLVGLESTEFELF